ncbi:16S rRNA (cytidine(1402)-2'-O)-methyltransferase [Parvularcula sp. LCG005]|uniref:16S rRNA (cytidine(1402)-2'-O)-methyltransferase n=1 Tax=Parvularcula sp. LCG005 TaxID=3078805 RepID=UPI0029427821|nr:16S rRNA (cytidine(1402)-2'-O)-methyltransferase [Parvularcula sp. LCG005]WOI53523.1 16S rRNA (cytidine(1402)-2'-O)-methyltransferase [Parvularcula sp. LCG005]
MTDNALAPGLYVAATPIGNLGDITRRLQQTLAAADEILCEDTRVTGKLLQALGIKTKMRAYHDHNGAAVRPQVLDAIEAGGALALVSDAGTPLIADPGFKLVREARERGLTVVAIPGPCAAIAALSIAGVPTDRFSFQGFLPPKSGARRTRLNALSSRGETLVFYETGPRIADCLRDIAATLGDGPVLIARELTKLHEEVVEGDALSLADRYDETAPKGEIVLIVPARADVAMGDADVDRLMAEALETMSLKDASAHVASVTGRKKRDLYQRWLDQDR